MKTKAVSDLIQNCKLDGSTLVYVDSEEEEVVEGHVFGEPVRGKVLEGNDDNIIDENENAAPAMVNYDAEDGEDTAGAMEAACRNLQRYEFEYNDLNFYFNQVEIKMKALHITLNSS